MNILFIITELDYGGAEKLLLNTCEQHVLEGDKVELVYLTGKGLLRPHFEALGVKVYKYELNKLLVVTAFFKLVHLIKVRKYDVVHTHLSHASIVGRLAALIAGCKNMVNTMHSNYKWLSSKSITDRLFRQLDKKINNLKASQTIVVSNAVKHYLISNENGINMNKINLIHNAISFKDIQNKMNKPLDDIKVKLNEDNYIIISVGRLVKEKGHINLLKALNILINENGLNQIKCLIIGDGICRDELRKYINDNNLIENVFLFGFMENPFNYLKKSDLFIMPSIREGLGIAVLEAYYCGIPVLATDADGLKDIVINNITGISVKKDDYVLLASEILNFYQNRYDVSLLVGNAKEFVKGFNISDYVMKVKEVYTIKSNIS